ncbi:TRAP transporter small permease subunit [Rhodovibrionaceae bacterium A322]
MSFQPDSELAAGSWFKSLAMTVVLLLLFFLPLFSWPSDQGEAENWNGFDLLLGTTAAVGHRYDAALETANEAVEKQQKSLERFLKRVEKDEAAAVKARAKADANSEDKKAEKNADRKERRAKKTRQQYDDKVADVANAPAPDSGLWTNYFYYLFPLLVVLTPLTLLFSLGRSLLGKHSPRSFALGGIMVFAIFLAGHVWLGTDMLGMVTISGWLALACGLLLIPAALGLQRTADWFDCLNHNIGRNVAWLALFMVVVQFTLVLMRYVFGIGSIFVQESLIYSHGLLFMIAAAYTLLMGGHVRVDIFYRESSNRSKAIIDTIGVFLLLIPVMLLIWYYSLPYVSNSWAAWEGSRETSGIPAIFALKTAILIFAFLMVLQGLSLAFRSIGVLTGQIDSAGSATEGGH